LGCYMVGSVLVMVGIDRGCSVGTAFLLAVY